MGASGWSSFVPYDQDITAALQAARHSAFRAGAYWSPPTKSELELHRDKKGLKLEVEKIRKDPKLDPADRQTFIEITLGQIDEIDHELKARKSPPTDIDDQIRALQRLCAEDGTHSVIDIGRVGSAPGFGCASPLSDAALTEIFGSAKPSRGDVETALEEGRLDCRRGQARYIVVYSGEVPSEICFTGVTGD